MTEEEKEIKRMYMQLLEKDCYIDAEKDLEYPPLALSFGEQTIQTKKGLKTYPTPIGTYGNFSFVSAPPKSKKTFFISLLSAVYLKGTLDGFGGDLKGYRDGKCLVHFDTEQGAYHAQRVFKRVLDMTGLNKECYHTFGLRALNYKERIDFIEYYLYDKMEGKNIGLVVIDGMADLVSDVNNIEESNLATQKIMEWSARLNCHIVVVIHSNFGSDKPTGHLGSFLMKKTETEIQLELNTVNKDLVTVSCKRSRGFSFDTFSFKVNSLGYPVVEGCAYDPLKDYKKF
tara:strand:+ start:203 stop:1060 length:858 start_codon:yes stop_codon:yes gene_type:complete